MLLPNSRYYISALFSISEAELRTASLGLAVPRQVPQGCSSSDSCILTAQSPLVPPAPMERSSSRRQVYGCRINRRELCTWQTRPKHLALKGGEKSVTILSAPYIYDEPAAFAKLERVLWPYRPACPRCNGKE